MSYLDHLLQVGIFCFLAGFLIFCFEIFDLKRTYRAAVFTASTI